MLCLPLALPHTEADSAGLGCQAGRAVLCAAPANGPFLLPGAWIDKRSKPAWQRLMKPWRYMAKGQEFARAAAKWQAAHSTDKSIICVSPKKATSSPSANQVSKARGRDMGRWKVKLQSPAHLSSVYGRASVPLTWHDKLQQNSLASLDSKGW